MTGFSLKRLLCDRTRTANTSVGIRSIFGCVNRALQESAAVLSLQENRNLKLSAFDHRAAVGSQTLRSAQIKLIPQSVTGNSETCVCGGAALMWPAGCMCANLSQNLSPDSRRSEGSEAHRRTADVINGPRVQNTRGGENGAKTKGGGEKGKHPQSERGTDDRGR